MSHAMGNAIPSSAGEDGPLERLMLLVSCILGLLAGLGVFGFVCYLLIE